MTRVLLLSVACLISAPCLAHTTEVVIRQPQRVASTETVSIARGDLYALCDSWRKSGNDRLISPSANYKVTVGYATWTTKDENRRRIRINHICKPT